VGFGNAVRIPLSALWRAAKLGTIRRCLHKFSGGASANPTSPGGLAQVGKNPQPGPRPLGAYCYPGPIRAGSKSGLISAPRLPQTRQTNLSSMSDKSKVVRPEVGADPDVVAAMVIPAIDQYIGDA
jgi:hypothetical protein